MYRINSRLQMQHFLTTDVPKTKFPLSTCSSGSEGHKFEPQSLTKSYRHPDAQSYICYNANLLHSNQQAPVIQQQRVLVGLKITDISK